MPAILDRRLRSWSRARERSKLSIENAETIRSPRRGNSELDALAEVSARVGRNPLLVQAGTGNTSIKTGGVLWIKASGTWLAQAESNDIFVPVDLAKMRRCIETGTRYIPGHDSSSGVRLAPSIETAMHAILPHRVVIHVHSVNTIAWAVRRDGPDCLAKRLKGLPWKWIPYVPSGLPLAREIQGVLRWSPDVLILANHGLVVGGEDCASAEALVEEIENRLMTFQRTVPEPQHAQLEQIAKRSSWRVPDLQAVHGLGTDPTSRAILLGGTLYPCQQMFLGPSAAVLPLQGSASDAAHRYKSMHGMPAPFLLVEGKGVLVAKAITLAQTQVLFCLSQVVQRLDARAPIRYLSHSEIAGLSSGHGNQYRRRVERSGADVDHVIHRAMATA